MAHSTGIAGNLELLLIGIDCRFRVSQEHLRLSPVSKFFGRAGVHIRILVISGFGFAEDDSDQVAGTGGIVPGLHFQRNLVVGLGDDVFKANFAGIVLPGSKWGDNCHRFARRTRTLPAGSGMDLYRIQSSAVQQDSSSKKVT